MIPQQHGAFPTAQTCGNKLCLPDYETPEVPPAGLTLTLTLTLNPHEGDGSARNQHEQGQDTPHLPQPSLTLDRAAP